MGGRVSSSHASTPWILLNASFLRGATTHVSGIVIALTRGERLERKRASLLKRVRRALVFVLLILTHVAGAWLCVVFYMWFSVVVLRAAFKSGALSFVFVRARTKTCESAPPSFD